MTASTNLGTGDNANGDAGDDDGTGDAGVVMVLVIMVVLTNIRGSFGDGLHQSWQR